MTYLADILQPLERTDNNKADFNNVQNLPGMNKISSRFDRV